MRWFKIGLAGCVSLLAMTAHARADFVVTPLLFIFGGGSLLGGGTLTIAGLTLPQLAVAALSVGLQVYSALAARQRDPGQFRNEFEAPDGSEINAIGRCRLGAQRFFGNTNVFDRYRLGGHSKGPLVTARVYRLGGREVTVEADGYVSSPPWARPPGSPEPSYVQWQVKVGDGTETAWTALTTAFSSVWTSAHRVQGIAQSLVKYVSPGSSTAKFGKLYQGGEPDFDIEGDWNTLFDPRVEGCDPDDPATWVFSMNGPLGAARVMCSYPDLTMASFDWDFIAGEADKADVLVPTLTGTEPRSRMSGVWLSEAKRGDTMVDVLRSIGAEITTSDEGLVRIRLIDDEPVSEVGFTDRHILDFDWRSGPEAVERPNVCRLRYYSPERNYEMADVDLSGAEWARVDDEVTRYGEKILDLEYPFCPSASQAQRNAYRDFNLARADQGQIVTNLAGIAAWDKTYAQIDDPDTEDTLLCRIEPPRIDDEARQVDIPFTVWSQVLIDVPWNAATMERPAPEVVPDIQYESDLDTPDQPFGYAQIQYPGGAYELRVGYVTPSGGTVTEAVYREYDAGAYGASNSMTEDETTVEFAWVEANKIGERVDFRVRIFDAEDEGSYFSEALEVLDVQIDNTATAAPTLNVTGSNGDWQIEVIAPDDLNVVYVTVEKRIVPAGFSAHDDSNARPGETLTLADVTDSVSALQTIEIRAYAHTSDGTASPVSTVFSFTEPL